MWYYVDKDHNLLNKYQRLWLRSKIVNRESVERNSVKVWHWWGTIVHSRQTVNSSCSKKRKWVNSFLYRDKVEMLLDKSDQGSLKLISDWNARSLASPRLVSPCLATCTIPETRESVGRLSPQSSDGMQEERSEQNASSRSVQNHRFQVQLSHSRALWPTKRRHCPAGAVPVHLQLVWPMA